MPLPHCARVLHPGNDANSTFRRQLPTTPEPASLESGCRFEIQKEVSEWN